MPGTSTDRLVAALNDPDHRFTPLQVADLMGLAARWARETVDGEPTPMSWRAGWEAGYRARCAEENGEYLADVRQKVYQAPTPRGDKMRARQLRDRRIAAHARRRRHGDYPGGPVEVW